jgi:uncharacterized UBP type Zn finger protein
MFPCFSAVRLDPSVVQQLVDMGFPEDACKKAVYLTKNSGVEAAMQWVMEHIGDPGVYTTRPERLSSPIPLL